CENLTVNSLTVTIPQVSNWAMFQRILFAFKGPFMKTTPAVFALLAITLCGIARADFPKPSPYPITWELKFAHGKPVRIAVQVPGESVPKAYWYLPYTVTNLTDQERTFLPIFEMVTDEGK